MAQETQKALDTKDVVEKPSPNFHACDIRADKKYDKIRRVACDRNHDGKCIDVSYGISGTGDSAKSEVRALYYDKTVWTEAAARLYCRKEGGTFAAATTKTQKSVATIDHKIEGRLEELNPILHAPLLQFAKEIVALSSANPPSRSTGESLEVYVELELRIWPTVELNSEQKSLSGKSISATIFKRDAKKQLVYLAVLKPEEEDAQGDVISDDEIEKAIHRFMAKLSKGDVSWQMKDRQGITRKGARRAGVMHNDWSRQMDIVECYRLPVEWPLGDGRVMKTGTWVVVEHVLDKEIWRLVEEGKLTGASIMGHATGVSE